MNGLLTALGRGLGADLSLTIDPARTMTADGVRALPLTPGSPPMPHCPGAGACPPARRCW